MIEESKDQEFHPKDYVSVDLPSGHRAKGSPGMLGSLTKKINDIQKDPNVRESLNQLAKDTVDRLFGLSGELELNASISTGFREVTEGLEVNHKVDNVNSLSDIETLELKKRVYLNLLISGSSMVIKEYYHLLKPELDEIHPELFELSKQAMEAADAMLMSIPDSVKALPGQMMAGVSFLSSDDYREVNARAVTFPLLLHELSKGVVESIATLGQPSNLTAEQIQKVFDMADTHAYDFYYLKKGGSIWRNWHQSLSKELSPRDRTKELIELVKLPAREFIDEIERLQD